MATTTPGTKLQATEVKQSRNRSKSRTGKPIPCPLIQSLKCSVHAAETLPMYHPPSSYAFFLLLVISICISSMLKGGDTALLLHLPGPPCLELAIRPITLLPTCDQYLHFIDIEGMVHWPLAYIRVHGTLHPACSSSPLCSTSVCSLRRKPQIVTKQTTPHRAHRPGL